MRYGQPTQEPMRRPHVEIRAPRTKITTAAEMAPKPNTFAKGVGSLQEALAQRQLDQSQQSDPWGGMRGPDVARSNIMAGIRGFFGMKG